MRLGLHYWTYSTPSEPSMIASTHTETVRIAEHAGLSSFTVMDHYFQMEHAGSADEPRPEGDTTLGYLAGRTERMALGLLVTGRRTVRAVGGDAADLPAEVERGQRTIQRPALPARRDAMRARADQPDCPRSADLASRRMI